MTSGDSESVLCLPLPTLILPLTWPSLARPTSSDPSFLFRKRIVNPTVCHRILVFPCPSEAATLADSNHFALSISSILLSTLVFAF